MDAPFLFPINPEEFFSRIQKLIDDTISKRLSEQSLNLKQAPDGLLSNPLLSMKEVCALFKISKPTLYEWVAHGKLNPYKIRGRVYFLQAHIQALFENRMPQPDSIVLALRP